MLTAEEHEQTVPPGFFLSIRKAYRMNIVVSLLCWPPAPETLKFLAIYSVIRCWKICLFIPTIIQTMYEKLNPKYKPWHGLQFFSQVTKGGQAVLVQPDSCCTAGCACTHA